MNHHPPAPVVPGFLGLLYLLCSGTAVAAQQPGTEFLTIQDHPDRGELVLALGPIDLPAHTTPQELPQLPVQQGVIPFDLMAHGYRVEAVDSEGRPVSQQVIHHFNMLDPTRRELFLPIMQRTFASGQETDVQEVPAQLYGMPLTSGDPFLLLTKVFNPTDQAYEGVSVQLILKYTRGGPQPQYRVRAFHLDAMFPLGLKAFDLPPGAIERSWEGRPVISGRILAMGGHLHPYATSLRLEDATEGKTLYEIHPEVRAEGYLESVPVVQFTEAGLGLPIDPTHVYRVAATYYNPTGETIRNGGMASVAGAFIPDDEDAWPSADPSDPLYATDYRNVLASTTALGPGLREPSVEHLATAAPRTPPRLPEDQNELVRFIDHPEKRVLEMVVGPATLRETGHHLRLPIQLVDLPLDGWLHGFEWTITDSRGAELPDELLHHINLIDPDRRDLFSPMARRVMAGGRETSKQEMPRLLGYPVQAGTRVLVSAMFARPSDRDYEDVYLHVRLSYTRRAGASAAPTEVMPFYLDVMGPVGRKSFSIPPGGTIRSWTASPAVDGRFIAIGAHLHDGARSILLEDLTAGVVVWRAEPEGNPGGHITGVPATLFGLAGPPIYKTHRYRLVVRYENATDAYDPEPGMGEIGGLILVSEDVEWPALDRRDPVYVADLMNTLEAPTKLQGH